MPAAATARATAQDLLDFIGASPSPFHAVAEAARRLDAAGFTRLDEADPWEVRPHGRCYVTRNDSTLAAFIAGGEASAEAGWRLIGAHTDSPSLKLKPEPVIERHGYVQLGVEVYGGPLHNSWLDRDLGLAGRVVVASEGGRRAARPGGSRGRGGRSGGSRSRDDAGSKSVPRGGQAGAAFAPPGTIARLWRLDAPLGRIPQLAIHLDREVNDKGLVLNRESHLVPVIGLSGPRGFDLREWLGEQLGVPAARILDHDLFFHDLSRPTFAGLHEEFLFAPRLDNLASSFCALSALIAASAEKAAATRVIALYDNEEIGSGTRQGADSSFLEDVLLRLAAVPGEGRGIGRRARVGRTGVERAGGARGGGDRAAVDGGEAYIRARARSLLVSADMAHAVHPNYADRNEARHQPRLNGGPVVKYNANARYATDAASGALFQAVCREARVPFQKYVNRADLVCGSTIGPIVARRIGVPTVDVGCPQLAMHSAREMAGAVDPSYMIRAMSRFLVR